MKKLGLIAGKGNLPVQIREFCKEHKIQLFVILVKGFGNKNDFQDYNCIELNFTSVGKAIKFFKNNKVNKILFAGNVKKPSFNIFTLDLQSILLLKAILQNKFLGDDSVLSTVINFFNKKGFEILEIDKILDNIKLEKGFNSFVKFQNKLLNDDIELGKSTLEKLSDLDIGQSIVVQQKNVIGIECIEGTEQLIKRCGEIKYTNGNKPILIKIKKVNQTRRADLPTIGPDTIEQLYKAGFCGLAFDYQNCLVMSIEKVIELSNKYKIFLYGI